MNDKIKKEGKYFLKMFVHSQSVFNYCFLENGTASSPHV